MENTTSNGPHDESPPGVIKDSPRAGLPSIFIHNETILLSCGTPVLDNYNLKLAQDCFNHLTTIVHALLFQFSLID